MSSILGREKPKTHPEKELQRERESDRKPHKERESEKIRDTETETATEKRERERERERERIIHHWPIRKDIFLSCQNMIVSTRLHIIFSTFRFLF